MHFQMLSKGRSGACKSLMKQKSVLMDETERYEFREASIFILDLAQQEHLTDPMFRRFRVSIHHRRSGADAAAVCGANDFDPLRGGELIGRKNVPDFVVKNFG